MKNLFLFSKLFNRVYFIFLAIFIVIMNTSYEVNHVVLKPLIFLGLLVFTPILLSWDIYFYRPDFKKVHRIFPPILGFIYLFYINPLEVYHISNVWKTENVLFQNKENPNLRVEIQTRKSLSNNNSETRIAEVNYMNSFFLKVKNYNKVHFDKNKWNKIQE